MLCVYYSLVYVHSSQISCYTRRWLEMSVPFVTFCTIFIKQFLLNQFLMRISTELSITRMLPNWIILVIFLTMASWNAYWLVLTPKILKAIVLIQSPGQRKACKMAEQLKHSKNGLSFPCLALTLVSLRWRKDSAVFITLTKPLYLSLIFTTHTHT